MYWLKIYQDNFYFFFKQRTAYEMRISDWSSYVCSSDLGVGSRGVGGVAPTYGFGGARIIAASLVPACHVPSPATRGLRTDRTALAGAARGQPVPRPEPRHRHQVRVRRASAGAGAEIGRAAVRVRVWEYR